jgi:transcriptional regulator with XRE-family HTH domain
MEQSGLAGFIKEKMTERHLSTYDIARLSGERINANTITRILNGDIKEAKLSTLEAISIAFEMPIGDLVRISMGKSPKPSRFEIYAETFDAGDISEDEWSFLENYFRHHVDEFRAFKTAAAKRTKKA